MPIKAPYDQAREDGTLCGLRDSEEHDRRSDTRMRHHFIIWVQLNIAGGEAYYRQFAIGYDPANKSWAEGNND
jgi:hypothetical protein